MTELQEMMPPILEARAKNRAKNTKAKAAQEALFNKRLRRINWAIMAGMSTKKEMTAAKKELDALEAGPPIWTSAKKQKELKVLL
jgi:hypothetical protein